MSRIPGLNNRSACSCWSAGHGNDAPLMVVSLGVGWSYLCQPAVVHCHAGFGQQNDELRAKVSQLLQETQYKVSPSLAPSHVLWLHTVSACSTVLLSRQSRGPCHACTLKTLLQGLARQVLIMGRRMTTCAWCMLQDSLNEALRAELTRLQATAAEALQQQGAAVSAGPPAGLAAGLAALGPGPSAATASQIARSPALPPQPSSLGDIAAAAAGRARVQAAAAAITGGSSSPASAAPPFDMAAALAARSGTATAPASLGEQALLWPRTWSLYTDSRPICLQSTAGTATYQESCRRQKHTSASK